jgi:glutamate/tyrosine decarboxylase-like PLP-dependent enzyme
MSRTPDDDLRVLERALAHAKAYLTALPRQPAGVAPDPARLRRRLHRPLAEHGVAAETVLDDLVADTADGLMGSAGGRFFGWVIGGALPAALAADWLTAVWDQNAALHACGPAAAASEEVAGAWLKELLGLPAASSFAFVTGCQMAHVTCLAAARHALLAARGWDVQADGLAGAPQVRILANQDHHGSIERAVGLLGLGRSHVRPLATDDAGRVQAVSLERALAADPAAPAIVVLQAGDIATGAFDDFERLIPIARRYGAWVHVDGAFGLWARTSPRFRSLTLGVEAAQSWATDGHKWLNVPFDSGYAFVADPEAHRAAVSHRAAYLTHAEDARDQIDWNPDWSRRARGFSTYAALRQLGRRGVADLVDRCCAHAQALAHGLAALPGAELVSAPIINQALVAFHDPRIGAAPANHDRMTDAVIAAINASGEAFFSGSTWRGRRVMRVSVCNWRTTAGDVDRAVAAAADAVAAISNSAGSVLA